MKRFLGIQHPFFLPVQRRVIVTAICAIWGVFEVAQGATGWAMFFWGLAAYLGWAFFVDFDPEDYSDQD